jgi:hypothetical protein
MIHKLVYSALLGLLATVVVRSLPDLARYLKIREM